ncbi:MAG: hypothetical protein QOG17_248, partial [Gammaproteobacteria bacterium]|nr:hypothetical protein [Gammaproteobacteria bacterium]
MIGKPLRGETCDFGQGFGESLIL